MRQENGHADWLGWKRGQRRLRQPPCRAGLQSYRLYDPSYVPSPGRQNHRRGGQTGWPRAGRQRNIRSQRQPRGPLGDGALHLHLARDTVTHTCTRDTSQNHKDTKKPTPVKRNGKVHTPTALTTGSHAATSCWGSSAPRNAGQCLRTGCQPREMHPGSKWAEARQGRCYTPLCPDGAPQSRSPARPHPPPALTVPAPVQPCSQVPPVCLHPAATVTSEAARLHRALEHTKEPAGKQPVPLPRLPGPLCSSAPEAPAHAGPDLTARSPPRVPADADHSALSARPALCFAPLCPRGSA